MEMERSEEMSIRRFEFSTGGSDKFWEVQLDGQELTVRYGRIGAAGLSQTKSFESEEIAQHEHDKLIAEKLKKGYIEAAATSSGAAVARNATKLKGVLEQLGLDLSSFEKVMLEEDDDEAKRTSANDSFFMIDVPKNQAMNYWRTLRGLVEQTGYWPIFTADHNDLFEFLDFNEDDPATVLKQAGAIDCNKWIAEKRAGDADLFREAKENSSNGWLPHSEEENAAHVDDFYVVSSMGNVTLKMILCPTKTPWHVAAVLHWGGSNDGIEPFEHTAMHKHWNTEYGAEPVCVTNSILEFRVAKPPKTKEGAIALAQEQFVYCPDIVHQGCETIAGLASELIHSPRWYFWWD